MLYSEKVIEYYNKIPQKMALWPEDETNIITATVGSYSAGEYVVFQLKLNQKNQVIDSRYQVLGCGYMIALVVWLSEVINHKYLNQIITISISEINQVFNLPQTKRHCASTLLSLIAKLEKSC
ncbi:iron-sulfur cluster assembly scaffold protein [Thiotrichales bacterium 19S3-7]|nr:iron-sulfur cluster assembly scaffold protein [Thiotrichales bacterium 19S3-7]MCF6800811.1 iron-sulfur cluster assembly scaffold protein [Thiotrichales bacterium 19S3-11]